MESYYTYPERSANDSSLYAEVSRGHSKPATSQFSAQTDKLEVSQKDEGLNVRKAKGFMMFMGYAVTTETLKRTVCVMISRKLKVTQKELS